MGGEMLCMFWIRIIRCFGYGVSVWLVGVYNIYVKTDINIIFGSMVQNPFFEISQLFVFDSDFWSKQNE